MFVDSYDTSKFHRMDVPFPFFVQPLQTFSETMQKIKVYENLQMKTPEKIQDQKALQ